MRRLVAGLVILSSWSAVFAQGRRPVTPPPDKVADYLEKRRRGGARIDPDAYDKAMQQWRKLPRSVGKGPKPGPRVNAAVDAVNVVTGVNGTVWTPIGPIPMQTSTPGDYVNGRIQSIAINPNNPNVLYIGASIGGVWRSIDAGANWTPLFDQQPALGIGQPGAIAIDPNNTNTLYVGTNSRFQQSQGILKSTDGGASWIVLGSGFPAGNTGNAQTTFQGQNISVLIVEPSNSNTMYLAASNGLYRSTNAGQNWTQGTNGGGGLGGNRANTMALDTTSPTNNRILYAGIAGSGVRRSTDGGQTWTQVFSSATNVTGDPPAVATAIAGGNFGKVVVALAPPTAVPNPAGVQVLYLTIEGTGAAPNPLGIFMSTDAGATWSYRTGTGLGTCQCSFTMQMGVDPASPGDGATDILFWGGTNQVRSTDSGNNFTDISNGQHADTRAEWAFVRRPAMPSIVYTGNDGGIYRTVDDGANWTGTGLLSPPTINAGGLQLAMLYHMDLKRDATASVTIGALQDNGSAQSTPTVPFPLLWTIRTGGDGFDVAFDYQDPVKAFEIHNVSATADGIFRSTDSGTSYTQRTAAGIPPAELVLFANQINVDPLNSDTIYVSGSATSLFQSTDGGTNFTTNKNFGVGNPVAAVDVAPANAENVVAVVNGVQVWVSTNARSGSPPLFTNITRNLPNRNVGQVAFDPNDPTVIYATLSGFNSQTPGSPGHVFQTTIGGSSWTDISPPLDVPIDGIALDGAPAPTTIYAGTDLGVVRSVDGGTSWTVLDDIHFPNMPVTDLKINSQAGVLRASTFGRGAFELKAPSGPVIAVNAQNGLQFGCGSGNLVIQVFNVGTQNLIVNSVQRLMGSTAFTVLPNPNTPILISPNSEVDFTVQYTPSGGADQATIRISSNDPAAPYYDLTATGSSGSAVISTVIASNGDFGNVCGGGLRDLALTISNGGTCDLKVSNITSSGPNAAEFVVGTVLSYPLVVEPGNSIQVPIRFAPPLASFGAKSATITVASNDPVTPNKPVPVSGTTPAGDIRLTGSSTFGNVCAGTLAEKTISVCNVGMCDLHVTSALSGCADFTPINNPFPATVSKDSCQNVTLRFTPTMAGDKSCNFTVNSDSGGVPTISTVQETGTTPLPIIDVPGDFPFAPTVIQSIGACQALQPFPVSNKGICNLSITSLTVGGANAPDFGLTGLPSLSSPVQPGHTLGDGALKAVFKPTQLDRDRLGILNVSYVSEPILGTVTTISPNMCGEGDLTGTRILVSAGGVPVPLVEKLQIQRITGNRNRPILNTVDNAQNLPLTLVTPALPCVPIRFHREYGTVANPSQLLPGSYQVTATAVVKGKRKTLTQGFSVDTCGFNQNVVVNF